MESEARGEILRQIERSARTCCSPSRKRLTTLCTLALDQISLHTTYPPTRCLPQPVPLSAQNPLANQTFHGQANGRPESRSLCAHLVKVGTHW